jgi:excinuclease ABC subunit C
MVDRAEKALLERTQLLHAVEEQMHRLAEQERFEEAARLRDRLDAIRAIQIVSETDLATTEDLDVLAILQTPERGIVMRLFVRHGRIISASHTLFRQPDSDQLAAAYTQALLDFYTPDLPMTPPRVLLADPLPPL